MAGDPGRVHLLWARRDHLGCLRGHPGPRAGTYFIFVILVYYAIRVLPFIPVVLPILVFTEFPSRLLWFPPLVLGLLVGRGLLPYLCKRQVRAHQASLEASKRVD